MVTIDDIQVRIIIVPFQPLRRLRCDNVSWIGFPWQFDHPILVHFSQGKDGLSIGFNHEKYGLTSKLGIKLIRLCPKNGRGYPEISVWIAKKTMIDDQIWHYFRTNVVDWKMLLSCWWFPDEKVRSQTFWPLQTDWNMANVVHHPHLGFNHHACDPIERPTGW